MKKYTCLFLLLLCNLYAHVKWFSDFSFSDEPLGIYQVLNPTFLFFAILSVFAIMLLVYLDKNLQNFAWNKKINDTLEYYKDMSDLIIRIAVGATMLLCWQADSILAPELNVQGSSIGWLQFVICFLLLFSRTLPFSGIAILFLYIYGMQKFGFLHMLDYTHYVGIGFFLLVSQVKTKEILELRLPLLYFFTGFSLCWLALEKIFYPQWTLYILEQNPQLALGFNLDFFRQGAAFVEFSLGYLLVICLLQRPLAVIITCVFFSTTLVFGKTEIIGHTAIHAILIVFLIEGPGKFYTSPIHFHKNFKLRLLFSSINFLILLFLITWAYSLSSSYQYEANKNENCHQHSSIDVTELLNKPQLELKIQKDSISGWNIEFITENFIFSPQDAGKKDIVGQGHIHLYINGKKRARVYSRWFHLPDLPSGKYQISASLNGNSHSNYEIQGKAIRSKLDLVVE
ncbi:hypothetical protein [Candidatus Uabimicrobium sp. HlEnr_7]|uniref:hypothetical protein n=1 Tax=Candidatus Uabimicrobium helgolandensis TaxID=3095367 RepID=UPI0035570003